MKIYFKPLILTTFSACISASVVTPVDAKVCFLADGRCNDQQIAPMVVGEICDFTIKETDCPSPKVLSTDYCTRSGIRLYESCTCPAEYQYDNTDEKYDYSNQCDDKYEKKICKAEYKYVASTTDVSTLDGETFHSVQLCKNNSVLDTSSEYCDEVYNGVNVRRYKSCKCDTSVYNYIAHEQYGYSGTVFKKGAECSVPGYASAFSTPSCTGNKIGEYYYRQSCNSDSEVEVDAEKKTWRAAIGSSAVTCRACKVKSCTDVGGSSYPIKGYRLKNTTLSNGNVCYTKEKLCQPGDYAIKGGYCYNNISDVTENMEKDLNALHTSKNYKLGVVTKATKQSDTKIVLRVVAENDANDSGDLYYGEGSSKNDSYTASSPTSIYYHPYDNTSGGVTWGVMTSEDVDAILSNTTVKNRVLSTFKANRSNLFAMLVDQTDADGDKLCAGNSKTGATSDHRYAYADVYQCYWVKHNSDSKVDRAVMVNDFSGIASKSNKWPRYSNGPHIYMRKNSGHNSKKAYQNYVWYSIASANVNQTSYCATTSVPTAYWQKLDANYSKITLEDIIFGRTGSGKCTLPNYIPLSYGVRYFEEVNGELLQRNPELPTAGSKWPYGVQPWRIGAMYAGECSDSESKKGACRDDGNGFSCNMRMYWHGTGFICPYSLQGNGSKEPTERCFSTALEGNGEYWYFGDQTTTWNYISKAKHSGSLGPWVGGYDFENREGLADYYKTGVQGCFIRPAVELTLDAELGDKSSGSLGSTYQPDLSDLMTRLGLNSEITSQTAYESKMDAIADGVTDQYAGSANEEGFDFNNFKNDFLSRNAAFTKYNALVSQKTEIPSINAQGGTVPAL